MLIAILFNVHRRSTNKNTKKDKKWGKGEGETQRYKEILVASEEQLSSFLYLRTSICMIPTQDKIIITITLPCSTRVKAPISGACSACLFGAQLHMK